MRYEFLRFEEQDDSLNRDELLYWKNKIFFVISIFMIIFGAPMLFFGAYMFYKAGSPQYSIIEILMYFMNVVVITRKSLSTTFKKFFIISTLYSISILLLVTTGLMGGGMVCVISSMVLTGCMLEKNK
jgi:hypothetical protein